MDWWKILFFAAFFTVTTIMLAIMYNEKINQEFPCLEWMV